MTTKDSFLKLLLNSGGKPVSGAQAAAALGVSRNAVWKAANSLKDEGLQIESLGRGGYRLQGSKQFYSEQAIKTYINNDKFPVRFLQSTNSTNNEAKQWAAQGAPHGALVAAKTQNSGKGRMGRSFESPEGGLYMSVVLRPKADMENAVLITAAAAVAACSAVSELCGEELEIKWVNDLFYNGKKCCGILSEGASGLENGQFEYIVCGIGINYTTPAAAFKGELEDIVCSIYPNGNPSVSHAQLAAKIHKNLLKYTDEICNKSFMEEYRKRSFLIGKKVTVMAKEPYEALVLGVDDDARLLVRADNGLEAALSSGEVASSEYVLFRKT